MKTRSYRNQKTTAGLQNTGPYTPTVHSFEKNLTVAKAKQPNVQQL